MPTLTNILLLLIAMALASSIPGPDMLSIVAQSTGQGRYAGMLSCLGIATGGLVQTCVVALGLSSVFLLVPIVYETMKGIGAIYLIYLGTRIVSGHSCWPQNGPFDANLAHLLSCNTASLCKNTTHKTPQSAGRFVIWLLANKWHFLFRHLVMIGVTTDTFCVDFWRFLLRSRTIPAKQRVHRLSSSFQDGFAGQERDHLPDQISHTPWAEPGNVAQQRTILYDMLSMARSVSQPGLVIELPYRWRRETYPPIVDWTADSGAAVSVPQTKSLFGNHVRY